MQRKGPMARALFLVLLIAGPVHATPDAGVLGDAGVDQFVSSPAEIEIADSVPLEDEADDDTAALGETVRYSGDLSDEELSRRWVEDPSSLGSISVGLTEAGRLINGVAMPEGPAWQVVDANNAWGTQETVDFIAAAAIEVQKQHAGAPPLRINHIGRKMGGYLRPHQSHQAGRDVDLGFYYTAGEQSARLSQRRELAMDLPMNWALVKALIIGADVQFILVDKRIQSRLYAYALEQGEDKAWLDKLFHAGPASLVKHARRHRDHFHVRFFSGRSQELGRRIHPLLAKQPEQNVVIHRVRPGDTLGALATRYNSGLQLIQKANGLASNTLRVGRTLHIPIRGPCTNCPRPMELVIPPRCLPPEPLPKS